MPIRISRALRGKLPNNERQHIEGLLRAKPPRCNLCEGAIDYDNDDLVADHDIPEAEGGETNASNLFLVHTECNSVKKDQPTERVRPYLRFRRFVLQFDPFFYLNNAQDFFEITPVTPSHSITGGQDAKLRLHCGGTSYEAPVFREPCGPLSRRCAHNEQAQHDYEFCYIELPFNWIMNDEGVQPRRIYHKWVWKIYKDLLKNPLHEAPCLRFVGLGNSRCELKMFDGQHKTVAAMLRGYRTLVFKVYLNLEAPEANILVNSIQDEVTKQTLNIVESVSKFSSEFSSEWIGYIGRIGVDNASEMGFIEGLESGGRLRAKKALKAKLQADFFAEEGNADLQEWLTDRRTDDAITKKAFSQKFLLNLINPRPLRSVGREGDKQRERERTNATRISRFMLENYWRILDLHNASEAFVARSSRLRKQVALQMSADLFRYLFRTIIGEAAENPDDEFLLKELNSDQWQNVESRVRAFFDHPYWTAGRNPRERPAVGVADNHLERNESSLFNSVRNTRLAANFPYALLPELPEDWGT